MVILDDPLSALDKNVAEQISDRLLGPRGLFKKMNAGVLLISNTRKSTFSKTSQVF